MIQLLKSEVYLFVQGFPGGSVVKNLPANAEDVGLNLGSKIPWKRKWQPTPVFLPGESHGQRSLAAYSPWCCRVRYDSVTKQQKSICADMEWSLRKVQWRPKLRYTQMHTHVCICVCMSAFFKQKFGRTNTRLLTVSTCVKGTVCEESGWEN